jgi:hypothetical protein
MNILDSCFAFGGSHWYIIYVLQVSALKILLAFLNLPCNL